MLKQTQSTVWVTSLLAVLMSVSAFAASTGPKIDKPDLDVTYISRSPRYPSLHGALDYVDLNTPFLKDPGKDGKIDKFFPGEGDKLTFTAHFTNKGTEIEGELDFTWKIDGSVVKTGKIAAPKYNEYAETSIEWMWEEGPHTVTFEVDPDRKIDEFSTVNSSKTDRTDSLGFLFFCRRDAYDRWDASKNMVGTYSFEDWMNWHFDEMNRQFAAAKYPACPDGCNERVHVERFVIVKDAEEIRQTDHFGYSGYWDFRETNAPIDRRDGALIHELGHQIGLIDQYAVVFSLLSNPLIDKHGQPALRGYQFFQQHSNMQSPGAFKWSELTAEALNRQKGYPRGYFGTYLFDHADNYSIRVLDRSGKPLPRAKVTYYRSVTGMEKQQQGRTNRKGIMKLDNKPVKKRFKMPHSPFEVKPTPFGKINILGNNSVLCFQVEAHNQEDFVMTEAAWFLVNYWRTGKEHVTVDIQTNIGPARGPKPPKNAKAEWSKGYKIKVSWDPPDKRRRYKYNIYRSHLEHAWAAIMAGPELVAEGIETTSAECQPRGESMKFHVTTVDEKGLESGVSRQLWVPMSHPLKSPTNIVYDSINDRFILSSGQRIKSWSQSKGFWPITYWNINLRGLTINADGDLLAVIGNTVRLFDMTSPTPTRAMMTYGDRKNGPSFNKPMDVAVDGNGAIVVADTGNGRILVLAKNGDLIAELGGEGPDDDKIQEPISVTITPEGRIIVGDTKLNRLIDVEMEGNGKITYDTLNITDSTSVPSDLMVDSEGNLIVVDTGTRRVYMFPRNFVEWKDKKFGRDKFGGFEFLVSGNGVLRPRHVVNLVYPTSAAIAKNGALVVYDSGKEGMGAFVRIPSDAYKSSGYYLQSLPKEKLSTYACVPPTIWKEFAPTIDREAWHIVGPFPNDNMEGFETVYPPETERGFNFRRKYDGVSGKVTWQKPPPKGCPDGEYVNLNLCFKPNDAVCAYAATTIISDSERKVRILTGSDDTITLWLNGEKVLSKKVFRPAAKAQETTDVTLRKGQNRVLIKICEGGGGWGFYFQVVDPDTAKSPKGVHLK